MKRGFIVDDLTDWDAEDGEEEEAEEEIEVPTAPVAPRQPQNTLFKAKVPCWTVIYSATKDGDIKTGEAYSNAVSMTAAKADVNAKLSQCGYDNITILAIENCTNAPKVQEPTEDSCVQAVVASEVDEKEESKDDNGSDKPSDEGDEKPADEEDTGDDEEPAEDTEDGTSGEDESSNDGEDEESSDEDESSNEDDDASDDEAEESDEESDEEDTSDDESDELDANEKAELRALYRKTFKNTLVKCKFDTSFNDLTLEQKVKFFTELAKAWKKENEPQEFMTDKELEQLDNVVADVDGSSEDEDTEDETSNED